MCFQPSQHIDHDLCVHGLLCRTTIGKLERELSIGDAALTGIVWAFSLDDVESALRLHCPPIILRWLASKYLKNRKTGSAANEDILLAQNICETIPYPFNSSLQGEAFEDLSLIAEVCRQSLLSEGKHKVCTRPLAVLKFEKEALALLDLAQEIDLLAKCCHVAFYL